ncbi:hypothetical protein BGZ97_006611 [Linnemannia gamsii]|uniref:Thioredoxin domain-containing protein n=1 Tax=Linnemannia gamsii TaxID=64522 RepID=A0A9P6URM4_9FUNG|nr:hypothetical protein BGZ97_006611 [Linnemannia gamsii]
MPVADPNSPEERLKTAYNDILSDPFDEKYEDTWEEDTYWAAVESFKLKVGEIGIDDPFEILKKFNITSYQSIRDRLKAGPPACLRAGWKSPYIGTKVDPLAVVAPLKHVNGPEFNGQERVVVLDFWATWCGPCVRAGPELSDLSEKYAGRVAIVGVNNQSMFRPRDDDISVVTTFLEEHKKDFRYTIYVDNEEGHARETVYKVSEYRAIPCVIVIVEGVVTYVGGPYKEFLAALEVALDEPVAAKEE